MLKGMRSEVWAFDLEWVPDVESGRRAYDLPSAMDDETVLEEMWQRGGATDDDPHPYLKTVLCRVVSIAAVIRKHASDGSPSVILCSAPMPGADGECEADLLSRFLEAAGLAKPQLVGFNSRSADLTILLQRAMVNRLRQPAFCQRPDKPWEGMDYFSKASDAHIDLIEVFGGWGKGTPSLHEFATACGVPGKMLADGGSVVDLWLAGDVRRIVQYNECDALSTYLLWLRAALLAGHFTVDEHAREEERVECLLAQRGAQNEHAHLLQYLDRWKDLRAPRAQEQVLVGAGPHGG